jgi:hypothetical protein
MSGWPAMGGAGRGAGEGVGAGEGLLAVPFCGMDGILWGGGLWC